MNFRNNIRSLISDAHRFQYSEITDAKSASEKRKPILYFTKLQWFFILVSIILASFIQDGFSISFAGYIISGLSLFIGVFFTFLISLYEKFKNINFSKNNKNVSEIKNISVVKQLNFFKKLSVLSLYSVLLSVLLILLLSLTLLFGQFFSSEIDILVFFSSLKCYSLYNISYTFLLFFYRAITLYFLLNFVLVALFIISAYYDFIINEIDQQKLK